MHTGSCSSLRRSGSGHLHRVSKHGRSSRNSIATETSAERSQKLRRKDGYIDKHGLRRSSGSVGSWGHFVSQDSTASLNQLIGSNGSSFLPFGGSNHNAMFQPPESQGKDGKLYAYINSTQKDIPVEYIMSDRKEDTKTQGTVSPSEKSAT